MFFFTFSDVCLCVKQKEVLGKAYAKLYKRNKVEPFEYEYFEHEHVCFFVECIVEAKNKKDAEKLINKKRKSSSKLSELDLMQLQLTLGEGFCNVNKGFVLVKDAHYCYALKTSKQLVIAMPILDILNALKLFLIVNENHSLLDEVDEKLISMFQYALTPAVSAERVKYQQIILVD